MLALILIFTLGLLLNLALTPIFRTLARKVGLVDKPDGRRKLQSNAIPVAGGPALIITVMATVGLAAAFADYLGSGVNFHPDFLLVLLAASTIICVVGIIDDAVGLRGRYKLLGQFLAVGVVIACGIQVHRVNVFDVEVELGIFSIPLTLFLLLGAINSLNLLDGMDGLLGSVGLIVCATFGAMAVICGKMDAAWIAFALAGALLGFLKYNLPPASVYLGDSGSMLVGLSVGVLAIQASLKGPASVALIAPACVLVVPIFDTAAAIVRRKLIGRSIFSSDRGHLHHCLLQRGISCRRSLLIVVSLCMIGMVGGLASIRYRSESAAVLAGLSIVMTLIVTRLFGYNETRLILKRIRYLSQLALRNQKPDSAAILAVNIQGKINWQPVWNILLGCSERLGLRRVRLDIEDALHGESFHARVDRNTTCSGETSRELKILFPLEIQGRVIGRVEVHGDRTGTGFSAMVSQLTGVVHEMELMADQLVKTVQNRPSLEPVQLVVPSHSRGAFHEVIEVAGEGGLA
jgi:UDP-GlcNAc:undecaprenyl-phosphate GlcNAc-1-phosphate transferase